MENDYVNGYAFVCDEAYFGFQVPTPEYINELAESGEEMELPDDYLDMLRNIDMDKLKLENQGADKWAKFGIYNTAVGESLKMKVAN